MFLTKVNNIFIKLFTAIMMDKLKEIDHFVGDDVYAYANDIVANVKNNGCRQMYDELNVKDSKIIDVIVNDGVYQIKVFLQSRYMDYIINLSNDNVISGNDSSRIEVNYNLTFTKKINAKDAKSIRRCPSCNAPLSVNTSGLCEYCGSIYNQEEYDWVLTKLEVC
jgi:hypothetical protein